MRLTQALHQRFNLDLLLGQRPPDHARRLKLPPHLPEQCPLRWRGLRPHPLDRHRIPELAFDRLTERPDLPLHSRAARQAPVLTPDPILIRALDLLERLLGRRRQTRDRDRRRRTRLPLGLERQADGASVMRLPLAHLGHKARRRALGRRPPPTRAPGPQSAPPCARPPHARGAPHGAPASLWPPPAPQTSPSGRLD